MPVGIFDHFVEVAGRLMGVDDERKIDPVHVGSRGPRPRGTSGVSIAIRSAHARMNILKTGPRKGRSVRRSAKSIVRTPETIIGEGKLPPVFHGVEEEARVTSQEGPPFFTCSNVSSPNFSNDGQFNGENRTIQLALKRVFKAILWGYFQRGASAFPFRYGDTRCLHDLRAAAQPQRTPGRREGRQDLPFLACDASTGVLGPHFALSEVCSFALQRVFIGIPFFPEPPD